MYTKLNVIENRGMFLVVEYEAEYESIAKNGDKVRYTESGIKIVPNPHHRCYNEMWEWDRIDRAKWDATWGEYYERARIKYLPKKK